MRTFILIFAATAAVAGLNRGAAASEIKDGNVAVMVGKDGCGLIDAVRYGQREVIKAKAGFIGASVSVVSAGDGSADSLLAGGGLTVLRAVVEDVQPAGGTITVKGTYTDGRASIPFTRRIAFSPGRDVVTVAEEADFSGLDDRFLVAKHSLDLPLAPAADLHVRMLAFGGQNRDELFRVDQNDINRGGTQLISAPRGHQPYWDIGGLLQLPRGYHLWKANHADTMAYPIEDGNGSPGWADYSELDWGVTGVVDEPNASAPWAIVIDARKGVFSFQVHPSSELPAAGKDLGKRRFRFRLELHPTSWPTRRPCELDFPTYRALLEDIAGGPKRPAAHMLYWPVGTADYDTIMHRERVQPSVILRTLYRGDAWVMQGRLKAIGKEVPRKQTMEKWEQDAKEYLDYLRKNGLPGKASK